MRRVSQKTARRVAECRAFRQRLVEEVGRCELCGRRCGKLCVHEIARGSHRLKALDQRYAVLVLGRCHIERIHNGKEHWPEARQLAILKRRRPDDYDLVAYNALVGYGLNRIAEDDVMEYS